MPKNKATKIRRYIQAVKNDRLTDDIVDDVSFLPIRVQNEILTKGKRLTKKQERQIITFYS